MLPSVVLSVLILEVNFDSSYRYEQKVTSCKLKWNMCIGFGVKMFNFAALSLSLFRDRSTLYFKL